MVPDSSDVLAAPPKAMPPGSGITPNVPEAAWSLRAAAGRVSQNPVAAAPGRDYAATASDSEVLTREGEPALAASEASATNRRMLDTDAVAGSLTDAELTPLRRARFHERAPIRRRVTGDHVAAG